MFFLFQNMLTTLLTPVRGVVLIDSALQRWLITRPEAALAAITDKVGSFISLFFGKCAKLNALAKFDP